MRRLLTIGCGDVALAKGKSLPRQLVCISTSGVYGDCEGDRVADRFGPPRMGVQP